jgi:hypothetical protein
MFRVEATGLRSARGLVFFPEITDGFRPGLPQPEASRAWLLAQDAHADFPEAVVVEEKLNWLSLDPLKNGAAIRDLLRNVVAGIVGGTQPELAYWAAGVAEAQFRAGTLGRDWSDLLHFSVSLPNTRVRHLEPIRDQFLK